VATIQTSRIWWLSPSLPHPNRKNCKHVGKLWYAAAARAEKAEADNVSLREELDKANRDLGAYRQAVERGEEDYMDVDGIIRSFIDEQHRLNGVVADMRKALETIASMTLRSVKLHHRGSNWQFTRTVDQATCEKGCWR
jgi:chromosome segregation ATPase